MTLIFFLGWQIFAIYVSFGNEAAEAFVYRSSLTVTLIRSQEFCLCYQVTLDFTRVGISTRLRVTHAEIKKIICTAMFVFNDNHMEELVLYGIQ